MRAFGFLVVCFAVLDLGAATPVQSQPPPVTGHRPDLDHLAGVYKHRFPNATVQGEHYQPEDIFEVVKLSPTTAYFRIHTQFYNGHECSLWGVADLAEDALVYRESPQHAQGFLKDPVQPCVLKFTTNQDGVIFNDIDGVCRKENCGARGGFGFGGRIDFAFKDRRRIRYMPLILASKEYAEAVKDHDGR